MRSPGINGEGELRGQPANPDSPGKMAVKMECVCVLCRMQFGSFTHCFGRLIKKLSQSATKNVVILMRSRCQAV